MLVNLFSAKNVLTKEGRVLLADFDSAKRIPSEITEPGLFPLGTRGFIAPEVGYCNGGCFGEIFSLIFFFSLKNLK